MIRLGIPRTTALRRQRTGFTLLELIAVLSLVAILAAVAVARYDSNHLADAEARTAARRIAVELQWARRMAIATGQDHVMSFGASTPVTYQVFRRDPSLGLVAASPARTLDLRLTVNVTPADPEFVFEGDATASTTIEVRGPNRRWRVQVQQIGGVVRTARM